MPKIRLPAETWTETFKSIPPLNLANNVSLVSRLFYAIAEPRMDNDNERFVPNLDFIVDKQNEGKAQLIIHRAIMPDPPYDDYTAEDFGKDEIIPIADTPPPQNILGFENIDIKYLNAEVLGFLRVIMPLGQISLSVDDFGTQQVAPELDSEMVREFHELLKGHVDTLIIWNDLFFGPDGYCDVYAEFVATVRSLPATNWSDEELPTLVEWLNHKSSDGRPKMVVAHFGRAFKLVDEFKKKFLSAISPASFVLHFDTLVEEPAPCTWVNTTTGEELTVGWHYATPSGQFILRRFPTGDDQTWRQMVLEYQQNEENGGWLDYGEEGANTDMCQIRLQCAKR